MKELIVPILMVHSVDVRSEDYLTVARDQFYRQVELLATRYAIVQVRDVLSAGAGKRTLPPNPVVISFDDSLKDNVEHALPVLDQFGAKAIFFAIAGYLGQNNAWNHRAYRFSDHMSARDLGDLARAGHEIGSHSLTHQRLTKLSDEQLEQELAQSYHVLVEAAGVAPGAFSYPYGAADARCCRACARYYKLGFASARQGCCDWAADPMNIRRIYLAPDDGPQELERKIASYRRVSSDA